MSDRELVAGDAFDLLPSLPADHAHAAVVDYPWTFATQNGTNRMGWGVDGAETREEAMFQMAPDDHLPAILDELHRVLVPGAWVLFFADDRFQDVVRESIRDSALTFRRNWAWTPLSMGMGYYGRVDHYPIPVATNGDTERYVQGRGTLYEASGGRQTEYPTGKPAGLYRDLLAPPVLTEGERLLEPFCGSAPGRLVAVERDLAYWGCDVSPEAVEMARNRTTQAVLTDGGDDGA